MPRDRFSPPIWQQATGYGALLAAGTFALQWLDYRRLAHDRADELILALVAGAFLILGIVVGIRAFALRSPVPFDGNPRAVESLGLTARELAVLRQIAAGRSNKQIAQLLDISPNTVKTHVARLYVKLGAARRTDAVGRARELGILP